LIVRASTKKDIRAIKELHQDVFGGAEGESVATLVADLFQDVTAQPLVSLVVVEDSLLLGNIIFSPVSIDEDAGLSGYLLAPLAVHRRYQKSGIGSLLISEGLAKLKQLKADFVLVLGDPNYYRRAGFSRAQGLKPPYDIEYPEAWMAMELYQGAIAGTNGHVRCADSLYRSELW
jgi:predicted N-acetyltransferase YhbS